MLHQLAIDAGGTSTRAMVLTSDGTCLGIGRGGRGNPVSDGAENAAAAIATAVAGAIAAAAVDAATIGALTLAMAGGLAFASSDWLDGPLGALGLTPRATVEPDLLAMFCSGSPSLQGYGLVAGTGATAVRVEDGAMAAMADGLGWLLGDSGSGFWIGHQVVRAVAADLDGRGPATSLTPRLLAQLEIARDGARIENRPSELTGLIRAVYGASPLRLATFAPLVFHDPDDDVSSNIVDTAVEHLARAVLDVADPALPGPLVIGGGVGAQPRIRDGLVARVSVAGVNGPVIAVEDGLVGAAVLGLRSAGSEVDPHVFTRLQESTRRARA